MGKKYCIEFNFDLSMEALDDYYPGGRENRRAAYDEIGRFLHKKNFIHVLKSTYSSLLPYSNGDIEKLINEFFNTITWAEKCMQGCRISFVNELVIDALQVRQSTREWAENDELSPSFEPDQDLDFKIQYCRNKIKEHQKTVKTYEKLLHKLETSRDQL